MNLQDGMIMKGIGGFYYVETANAVYECKARGNFRKEGITPLPGDRVSISINENAENRLEKIYPRKNSLIRPPVANIDQLIIVASMADPAPNLFVIDKLIAVAERKSIEPVIIFNKTDLAQPERYIEIYLKAGFQCFACSKEDDESLQKIRGLLKDKISAFTGNTGVGKSTILNAVDSRLALETGEISKKLGRGRHTTRYAELFQVAGGYVADTAGFSSLDIERCETIYKEELPACFRDFRPYLDQCRFTSCAHLNDKGCAVVKAVSDGEIAASRHESYKALYEHVKDLKEWNVKNNGR